MLFDYILFILAKLGANYKSKIEENGSKGGIFRKIPITRMDL